MKTLYRFAQVLMLVAAALWCPSDTLASQDNTLLVGPTSLTFTYQTGAAVPPAQSLAVSTTGANLVFTASAATGSGGSWLSLSTTQGTTPAGLSVSINPSGLGVGTYSGSITITATGASNSPVTVAVSLSVVASTQLTVSPGSLSFNFQTGGSTPPSQTLAVSSNGSPLNYTVTEMSQGSSWLILAPAAGTTPGSITVSVNPAGLAPGTYSGSITVSAAGATNSPVTVAVTLTVSASPQLIVSPTALQFNFQIGGAVPASQLLSISSSGSPLPFAILVSTNNGGSGWLVVGPLSGATPASLGVSVNPAGLSPGTYTGSITVAAGGSSNGSATVGVTLLVSTSPLLNASPASLSFNFQVGGAAPGNQSVMPTSTGAALSFTASAATATGGAWLLAGPLSGTTPATVTVAVNPAGLAPGTYNGSVTFSASGAGNGSQTVAVTLVVSNNPLLNVSPAALSFGFQIGTAAPANQTVSITSTGTPLSFTAVAATNSGGSWLAVTPSSGTTPATLTVVVNVLGLATGTYTGSITLSASGAVSPQTIGVTLVVSNTALLVSSPASLTFSAAAGASGAGIQAVSLTSTDGTALNYTVTTSTSAGGAWLLVGPLSGATPSNLSVAVNPSGLSAGTYTGSIVITSTGVANSPQTISVTLTITSSVTLAASPGSLSFSQLANGPPPASQILSISTNSGLVNFSAVASTGTGVAWLSVTPNSGTTPATLSVAVNGAGLSPGTYTGAITLSSPGAGNSPLTVQVILTVGGQQALFASPASLAFSYQIGGTTPTAQSIAVSAGGGAALSITATAAMATGSGWLSVSPTSATTPISLSVSVSPANLTAGTYNGTITITSPSSANGPQTVNVTLTVTAAPLPTPVITAVDNAASFLPMSVSPGEIVTFFGVSIGPPTAVGLRLKTDGTVDTNIGNTQVTFDGNFAPMVYASGTQVSAIVPYEIANRVSTSVQIIVQGVASAPSVVRVVDSAPGIFTLDSTGLGQGAILNQNFSVNKPSNPAAKGSVVMIYATGEGQTTPGGIDGIITGNVLRKPLLSVKVTIGGQDAEVLYAGAAPTLVAGVLQVNARVPQNIASGSAVPVVVTVGNANSQGGVTMAVQ